MNKAIGNRKTLSDRIFGFAILALSILIFVIILYPLWFIVIASISNSNLVNLGQVKFWPKDIRFYGYQQIIEDTRIWRGYLNTLIYVLVGTALNMVVTMPAAYALSRRGFKARNKVMFYFVFTMFFSGGLIPYFILIVDLGLYDSFWVFIIPTMFSAYNMIIIQSFMRELPSELIESAKLDGASEYRIFFQMILPLSKPVLATIALFTVVTHWNSYFDSMMYTSSQELQTIQLFLKKVITDPSVSRGLGSAATIAIPDQAATLTPQVVKLATMVVTALPVVCIYPFLQRYFVKGVTVGAVKG